MPNFILQLQTQDEHIFHSPPPQDSLMQTPVNALPIHLNIQPSSFPLEALYNPTLNNFKAQEKKSDLDPAPLTLMATTDQPKSHHNYIYYNDERGIKMEHRH